MYLIEIIKRFGMDQGGMLIAIVKFKVRVLGNFSEHTSNTSHGLATVKGREGLWTKKGGMTKKPRITIYYPIKRIVTLGGGARRARLKAKAMVGRCRAGVVRSLPC